MLTVAPTPALAVTCTEFFQYRAGDQSNYFGALAVQGEIELPPAGQITGVTANRPSAADIYISSTNGDGFVQFGWYVGATDTGLPYTTTPRAFYGESRNNGAYEVLHAGQNLNWGTSYFFSIIKQAASNFYNYYLDSSYINVSDVEHDALHYAAFNGEVNYRITRMDARATKSTFPYSTLRYKNTGGNYVYFDDDRFVQEDANNPAYSSIADGGSATDRAYGGGSAYC